MGIYDPDRNLVCGSDRYFTACNGCGTVMLKKKMVTMLVKVTAYSNPRTIGHFCESCFASLCDQYEMEVDA